MFDVILLRLDAPMISFGTTVIDNYGEIQEFPALSMLTGLFGNALGFEHTDFEKLSSLQERIRYAVRCDRPGRHIMDFQTVDLGQPFMACDGWTTRGEVQKRKGEKHTREGTHLRYRNYWADSVYTVAVTLDPPLSDAKGRPSMADLEKALIEPYRPLFIGRKNCLPANPIFLGRQKASSLLECLREAPALPENRVPKNFDTYSVWWFDKDDWADKLYDTFSVCDVCDWANQIHVGNRLAYHGCLFLPIEEEEEVIDAS